MLRFLRVVPLLLCLHIAPVDADCNHNSQGPSTVDASQGKSLNDFWCGSGMHICSLWHTQCAKNGYFCCSKRKYTCPNGYICCNDGVDGCCKMGTKCNHATCGCDN